MTLKNAYAPTALSPARALAAMALGAYWASACAVGAAEDCDGSARLRALAATPGLHQQLAQCTAPLLFAPLQWAAADVSYCEQDACRRVVAVLGQLPSCAWTVSGLRGTSADEGDDAVRMARQVHSDCGSGDN